MSLLGSLQLYIHWTQTVPCAAMYSIAVISQNSLCWQTCVVPICCVASAHLSSLEASPDIKFLCVCVLQLKYDRLNA